MKCLYTSCWKTDSTFVWLDLAAIISDSIAPQTNVARRVDFVTGKYLYGLLQSPGQAQRSTKYR